MKRALLAALLLGCGSTPPSGPPLPSPLPVVEKLTLQRVVGGGYLTGCLDGERLYAARDYSIERWALPADGPPRLEQRIVLPLDAGPVSELGCAGDRLLVTLRDEVALGYDGADLRWRGAAAEAADWPAPTASGPPPASSRWGARLADGRETVLGAWGRGTRRGGAFTEWRRAAGGLRAAAWDGEAIWAAGDTGLWRWRPAGGEPVPIVLPAELAERPLVDLFRDAGFLWVRDAAGTGWPLAVQGTLARLAADPGPLPPRHDTLVAPVGARRVEARPGQPGATVIRPDGAPARLAGGHVTALVPLGGDRLAAAVDDEVQLWRLPPEGPPEVLSRITLGSPTVAIFVEPTRWLLVGRDYGFAEVAVRP